MAARKDYATKAPKIDPVTGAEIPHEVKHVEPRALFIVHSLDAFNDGKLTGPDEIKMVTRNAKEALEAYSKDPSGLHFFQVMAK